MGLCKFSGEEETGGFDDDVYAKGTPGDVGGIFLAEDLDLVAVYDHVVAFDFDVVVEDAVHGVVLEHVSQIVGIQKVVDTDDADVFTKVFNGGAEDHTADTAKTVNTKFDHNTVIYCLIKSLLFKAPQIYEKNPIL